MANRWYFGESPCNGKNFVLKLYEKKKYTQKRGLKNDSYKICTEPHGIYAYR